MHERAKMYIRKYKQLLYIYKYVCETSSLMTDVSNGTVIDK